MLKRSLLFGVLAVCAHASSAAVVQFDRVEGNTWFYNITLDPGTFLQAGDAASTEQNGVTLYDFPGLVSASFDPATAFEDRTWVTTTPVVGFTPPKIRPIHDTSALNVNLRLAAGDDIVPIDPAGGSVVLGQLIVTSSTGATGPGVEFSGQSFQSVGGNPSGNWSFVEGPLIPEPSTFALMGGGLAAVVALALRRRRLLR